MQGCVQPISQALGTIRVKPIHVRNIHLRPQYTPNNNVEHSNIPSGLLLKEYHSQHVKNSINTGFLDINLTRTLPQLLLWGSCKNLHYCIRTLVISGTYSSAPTFQHILHHSIEFKLVSDSCYCYPCWWCTKFNPPASLNFQQHSPLSNNTSVTTYVQRLIISPLCLFKMRPHGTSGWALASHHWGPEFASRSLHVGFVVDEMGSGQVFLGVSPIFPYHKFHSTISPHSSHPFCFISSALVMVHQAWSASTLATHGPIIWGFIASHPSTRPCVGHELRIFFSRVRKQNKVCAQILNFISCRFITVGQRPNDKVNYITIQIL